MTRIFLYIALMASLVGLSGCHRPPVNEVKLPEDVAAVTTPFLAAVRRGDRHAVEKFVAPNFADDSRIQFDEMSALLKKSPTLVSAIYQPKAGMFGLDKNEVTVTLVARDGGDWISSEIRMYREEGGIFEIEYWDVNSDKRPPELLAQADEMQNFMIWFMGAMAVVALFCLAILIWVIKRKTHIIAPEPAVDARRIAATTRDFTE